MSLSRKYKVLNRLVKIVSGLLCLKENLRFIVYVHGTIHFNTKYDYWADRIERNYNTTLLSQEEFEETKRVIRIVYRRRTDKTVISHE
jgi:CO dehydrogenase/acetyl-CoA synthase beta subunit